jgi:allophanate hydrolase subunit 2
VRSGGGAVVGRGIARGAVQVPGDGQPIVLLGARQTVGGYTKTATVIGADIDLLAQRRPGDRLRFVEVSVAAARDATRASLLLVGEHAVRQR